MATNWIDQSSVLSNTELSKEFVTVAQPLLKFRQFCDFKQDYGKRKGESINWMKVANLGTYGGVLAETNTMHESSQSFSWGTLTVNEYGNSVPLTGKVQDLSKFELKKILREGLADDYAKCMDGLIEREFNKTPLRYVGTSTTGGAVTTNSSATATNTSILNTYHLRKMILELKKRNVPGFSKTEGGYILIASHEAVDGLMGALESVYQYSDTGIKKLIQGEIGKYFDTRVVADGFASRFTYSSAARTATAKSWTQGQSLDAYLFGQSTVFEGIVVDEEIREKEMTDYKRSQGLAWYYMGGFAIQWSDEPNARIIKWDSAA